MESYNINDINEMNKANGTNWKTSNMYWGFFWFNHRFWYTSDNPGTSEWHNNWGTTINSDM